MSDLAISGKISEMRSSKTFSHLAFGRPLHSAYRCFQSCNNLATWRSRKLAGRPGSLRRGRMLRDGGQLAGRMSHFFSGLQYRYRDSSGMHLHISGQKIVQREQCRWFWKKITWTAMCCPGVGCTKKYTIALRRNLN
jgi:hypothetical protein